MDTLTSMKVFAAVVDSGSFAAAAERLGLSRAMASKHVGHLEAYLGTRLLHRTTRRLGLTESGAAYHEHCTQILGEIAAAEAGAARLTVKPQGTLRVAMPVAFSIRHMGPLLSAYLEKYPEVRLDAMLSDRRVDLIEEGVDLALRIGPTPESGLIAHCLATDRMVICASPHYLQRHGTPQTPADLERHNCVLYSYSSAGSEWVLRDADGEHPIKVTGTVRANNGDLLKQLAVNGIGVVRQPRFLIGDEIRAGRLMELLPDYTMDPVGIYAVYPSRKHLSAKIRSFVDHLAQTLPAQIES